MNVEEYEARLRQRVGEAEYARHKELVRLLARNLALEDILWEEILICISAGSNPFNMVIILSIVFPRTIESSKKYSILFFKL